MSKTLGKKSIKILSTSSFNNKAINSSNPNTISRPNDQPKHKFVPSSPDGVKKSMSRKP